MAYLTESTTTRSTYTLNGIWTGLGLEAENLEDLQSHVANLNTLENPIEIPFLEATPGTNAWLLRRSFQLPPFTSGSTWLRLGAAMSTIRVSLNEQVLGTHRGAYTPFEFRIDEAIKPGENEIMIELLGEQSAFSESAITLPVSVCSATLTGKPLEKWQIQTGLAHPPFRVGIWQDVRIEHRPETYIDEVKITPQPLENIVEIQWRTEGNPLTEALWTWACYESDSETPCSQGIIGKPSYDPKSRINKATVPGKQLKLWSPDSPTLYHLELNLGLSGEVADSTRTRFGYRHFEVRGSDFYLNGNPITLRGESDLLQNRGLQFANPFALEIPLFWSVHYCRTYFRYLKEQLDINSIRVHGSIGHPSIFQAADEVGLLLENQSSVWSRGYGSYITDFSSFMAAYERETEAWIKRDWNHPSVVIWGAENEMVRIAPDAETAHRFSQMATCIRQFDDSRPITFDGGAAAVEEATEIDHIHHEENYAPVLKHWQRKRPLVFGEFWIGSRGAEQRLTSGEEYCSNHDYLEKQAALWKARIEPMRIAGASGVFPYNFSAQWLRSWEGFQCHYSPESKTQYLEGIRVHPPSPNTPPSPEGDPYLAKIWRHLLGRYCVCLSTPNRQLVHRNEHPAQLPIHVRNDDSVDVNGQVLLKDEDGTILAETTVRATSVSTQTACLHIPFDSQRSSLIKATLCWVHEDGRLLDATEETLESVHLPVTQKSELTINIIDSAKTRHYQNLLQQAGLQVRVHRADDFAWKLTQNSVLLVDASSLLTLVDWRNNATQSHTRLIIVEINDSHEKLYGLQTLTFEGPLPYSWKFHPITNRETSLSELLLPTLGTWETSSHPIRQDIHAPYWHPSEAGSPISHSVLLLPGMGVSPLMKQVHGVGAGMDDANDSQTAPQSQTTPEQLRFRSLMTGSRREYSLLSEVRQGSHHAILSCLHLNESEPLNPQAAKLIVNTILYLQQVHSDLVASDAKPYDAIRIFHNCGEIHDPSLLRSLSPHLSLTEKSIHTRHVSIDNRSVFQSTKTASLCEPDSKGKLLMVNDKADIQGGWIVLAINHCFEVNGPFFPWEFQSKHPHYLGHLGVSLRQDNTLDIYLVESLEEGHLKPHLDLFLWNLEALEHAGCTLITTDASRQAIKHIESY